jgi:hypothetical protein
MMTAPVVVAKDPLVLLSAVINAPLLLAANAAGNTLSISFVNTIDYVGPNPIAIF